SHEVRDVLAAAWAGALPEDGVIEAIAPFDWAFPGLAEPTPGEGFAITGAIPMLEGYLGLIPVTRPADAVTAIGWTGPRNCSNDAAPLSAVPRSWEDRFGAYVVGIGFDTLAVAVERPPESEAAALAVAAEHFAFCPDNIWQGADSIKAYAAMLAGTPM